jgi:hypothetical protein
VRRATSPPPYWMEMSDSKKPDNRKTALILLSIVLMFFIGIFVRRIWFG